MTEGRQADLGAALTITCLSSFSRDPASSAIAAVDLARDLGKELSLDGGVLTPVSVHVSEFDAASPSQSSRR